MNKAELSEHLARKLREAGRAEDEIPAEVDRFMASLRPARQPALTWEQYIEALQAEDGLTRAEAEIEARETAEMMRPVYIWRRARDRRRPDGTGSVEFTAGASSDPDELARLVRRMAGKAGGRRRGTTAIEDAEQLRAPIRQMRRVPMRITQTSVERYSGITRAMIRGFLEREKLSWSEFLASF